jgi:FemAB-related protein (PEP-CTERM system-associated)
VGCLELSDTLPDTAIRVDLAKPADHQAWTAFVESHPDAGVFHDWRWLGIIERSFGHINRSLIAWQGESVVGILPLMEVKTLLFGHTLVSLPFCQWAGPLTQSNQAAAALRASVVECARDLGVTQLELRNTQPGEFGWPSQDQLYVLFRKPIEADDESNLKAIPRKQRAMIRKGIANELDAHRCSVESFYRLYTDNVHRHGTPCAPLTFFKAIQSAFGNDCEFLMVKDMVGTDLSCVLTLYWRNQVFPFYAGDSERARATAANDFKYWEVMRRGVERGCTIFNYGRSKRGTGSFDFKRNWGFEPEPLHYEYWLAHGQELPSLNPSNPKFKIVIETWRRTPRWIVNRLGPVLVRGLG